MKDQTRRGSPVYGMTDAQICDHWWRRAQWEEAEYQRQVAEAGEIESEAT